MVEASAKYYATAALVILREPKNLKTLTGRYKPLQKR